MLLQKEILMQKLLSLERILKNYKHLIRAILKVKIIFRYFKANVITIVTNYVLSWKSKGLSDETIKPPSTSDNSLTPSINYINNTDKVRVKFTGSCLKQSNKLMYTHGKVVNIYIVYELGASSSRNSDPTLTNCLFGAVTLTKNADIEKYKYSGYGIGFDRRSSFLFLVVDLVKMY